MATPTVTDLARRLSARTRALVRTMGREAKADRLTGLAAEVAFYALISLFPMLLAMAAALGSLESVVGGDLADRAEREVIEYLERVLTSEAGGTIDAVQRLFDGTSSGALTVGVVLALWGASRGFAALVNALDLVYDLDDGRGYLRVRALAVALAAGTVVVLAVVLAMVVLGPLLGPGQEVADRIGAGEGFATLWNWVRWPVVVALVVAWATTVFHVAPDHRIPWRSHVPGALLTAVLWSAVSVGLRVYLDLAGDSNEVLGTLGGVLIVLLWLYLMALGLLVGGELNSVLASEERRDRPVASGPDG